MEDYLSQDMIDQFMAELGDVPVSTPKPSTAPKAPSQLIDTKEPTVVKEGYENVMPYDFRSAARFSKDQIRTLQILHDTFARLFSSTLSAKIRTVTKIKVVSVEQVNYEEFIQTISNPSIISIFSLQPLEGTAVMDISPAIAFTLIDRLLGGSGEVYENIRELTEIETGIISAIIEDAMGFLKEAWSSVEKLNPKLEVIESNPNFVQIVLPSEKVALVTFEVELGKTNGRMSLAFPYLVLEPILKKLSYQQWFSTFKKRTSQEVVRNVEERLKKTKVELSVELGKTELLVREIISLEKGDIIRLNRKEKDLLDVYIGDKVKFKGSPGIVGKSLAVELIQVEKEKEDDIYV